MSAVQEVVLGHVTEWFKKAALSLTMHRPAGRLRSSSCVAVMRPRSGVKASPFTPKLQALDFKRHF